MPAARRHDQTSEGTADDSSQIILIGGPSARIEVGGFRPVTAPTFGAPACASRRFPEPTPGKNNLFGQSRRLLQARFRS
jgi:hypothetical protein